MLRYGSYVACVLCLLVLAGCNGEGEGGAATVTGIEPDEHGIYPKNPFAMSDADPPPVIEVPETSFDFGRMLIDTEDSHAFVIRNVGEAPIRLALGPKTCQCTLGSLSTDSLQPGEETVVTLKWHPETQDREFLKSAAIWTNVPEMERIDFFVRGEVVPQVNIVPGANWSAGIVPEGEQTVLTGVVYSLLEEDFLVEKVETSDEWLKASFAPADPVTLETLMGLSGFDLTCEILPNCPLGEFRGTMTIYTNLEEEFFDEIVITISGSRSGPFNISGRGWLGTSFGTMDMGTIAQDEGKTAELSLIMSPMDEPLELTVVEKSPEFLSFEMRRDDDYPATNKERYFLTFSVPAGAALGEWSGEDAGTITLRTNIPDREELAIRVQMVVE